VKPRKYLIMGFAALSSVGAMAADLEVRSPIIDPHEFEFDAKLSRDFDDRAVKSHAQGAIAEFEYAPTDWWSPAIEGEWDRPAGLNEPTTFEAITLESRFQFAKRGQYWVDPGLFVEYERGLKHERPNAIRLGPLLRKDVGPTINLLGLVAVREVGANARRHLSAAYAWQTRWTLSPELQPGFELYGGLIDSGAPSRHQAGPVFFGVFDLGFRQDIRYEVGYLFALDRATPNGTFKLLIGYEYQVY
jgi:hypothetical protein